MLSEAAQMAQQDFLNGKMELRDLQALFDEGSLTSEEFESITQPKLLEEAREIQEQVHTENGKEEPITMEEQEEVMGAAHPEPEKVVDLGKKRAEKQLKQRKSRAKPKDQPEEEKAAKPQENKVAKLPEGEEKVAKDLPDETPEQRKERLKKLQASLDKKTKRQPPQPRRKSEAELKQELVAAGKKSKASKPAAKKAPGEDNGNGRKRGVRWAVKQRVLTSPSMNPADLLAELEKAGVKSKLGSVASIKLDFLATLRAAKKLNMLKKQVAANVSDAKAVRTGTALLACVNETVLQHPDYDLKQVCEELNKAGYKGFSTPSISASKAAIIESIQVMKEGKALSV